MAARNSGSAPETAPAHDIGALLDDSKDARIRDLEEQNRRLEAVAKSNAGKNQPVFGPIAILSFTDERTNATKSVVVPVAGMVAAQGLAAAMLNQQLPRATPDVRNLDVQFHDPVTRTVTRVNPLPPSYNDGPTAGDFVVCMDVVDAQKGRMMMASVYKDLATALSEVGKLAANYSSATVVDPRQGKVFQVLRGTNNPSPYSILGLQ